MPVPASILKKTSTLFLAVELREARTTTGLYQNQTGVMLPINPDVRFDPERFDREINRGRSLTNLAPLNGLRTGHATFGLELAGGAGPSQFAEPIRCCAFADDNLDRFTIGAVTGGPFRHGERVDQASSGAFGKVVADTWDGDTVLWVTRQYQEGTADVAGPASPFDSSGVLVGASTGAQATPSALVYNGGRGWWPYSYRTSRVLFDGTGLLSAVSVGQRLRGATSKALATVVIAQNPGANAEVMVQRDVGHFVGNEVVANLTSGSSNIGTTATNGFEIALRGPTAAIGLIRGPVRDEIEWARGNVKLSGEIGKPAIFDFEFLGKERAVVDRGQNVYPDLSNIATPPVLLGADFSVGLETATPAQMAHRCIRSFSLDIQNELAIRKCMGNHGDITGPSHYGVAMAMVVGRKPIITLDPDLEPEAAFPWMTAMMNGTPLRMKLQVGSVAGNKFTMTIPSMVPAQAETGDVDSVSTRNVTLELTGGTAPGPQGDNEVVIVQDFS